VFAGESDGHFTAFDAETGQRLWQFQCGAGVNAAPMTYEVNGRQYIAVAAGGNAKERTLSGRAGERFFQNGGTIFVFALPKRSRDSHLLSQCQRRCLSARNRRLDSTLLGYLFRADIESLRSAWLKRVIRQHRKSREESPLTTRPLRSRFMHEPRSEQEVVCLFGALLDHLDFPVEIEQVQTAFRIVRSDD
jgi:hypothetical protein